MPAGAVSGETQLGFLAKALGALKRKRPDGSEEGGGGGSPPGGAASGGPAGGEATVEELAAGAEALAALQAARAECARERARADMAEAQLAKCRTRLVAEKAALKQAQ